MTRCRIPKFSDFIKEFFGYMMLKAKQDFLDLLMREAYVYTSIKDIIL